ncbi:MAG: hypothetical protein H0T51_16750 [Pirellulales bacterium]|nr:hypothetical protein [Pirellulales bacterium]
MSNIANTVTSVRWTAIFPWLILVRAARVSLMVRVIGLAVVGVALTQGGWAIIDGLTIARDDAQLHQRLTDSAIDAQPGVEFGFDARHGFDLHAQVLGSPLVRGWSWASQSFGILFERGGNWPRWFGALLGGLWAIAVWALFGGAIARIAALYLTRGETVVPLAALKAAFVRWPSTAGAPVFALIAIFLLSLPLIFIGWTIRLDFFALLAGLLWFLILIGGVALAVLAIGLAIGWPLMWSTVAVERTDAFDGISRGYAYVYQRPLHLLFFVIVAGALGLLAQAAINLIVEGSIDATQWAVSSGAGELRSLELLEPGVAENRPSLGGMGLLGSKMMRFWTDALYWFAAAFPMAYLFPAATGIYLLMRRQIDAADLGDVTFDEGDPQRGLPTLANDPVTSVPHVVDPAATAAPHPPTAPAP